MSNKLLLLLLIILMTWEFSSGAPESTACAACKLFCRRCSPDCAFRPYFPADKASDFANVHRLFGAANVNTMLEESKNQEERDEKAKSIICESKIRSVSPVYGCVGVIHHLLHQIKLHEDELNDVIKRFNSIVNSNPYFSPDPDPPPLDLESFASNPIYAEYFLPESTDPPLNPVGAASDPLLPEPTNPPLNLIDFASSPVYAEYFLTESTNNDNDYFAVSGGPLGYPNANANANAFLHTDPNDIIRLYGTTGNAIGENQAFQQGISVSTANKDKEEILLDWGEPDSEMESFIKKYGYNVQAGESSTKHDNNPFL